MSGPLLDVAPGGQDFITGQLGADHGPRCPIPPRTGVREPRAARRFPAGSRVLVRFITTGVQVPQLTER